MVPPHALCAQGVWVGETRFKSPRLGTWGGSSCEDRVFFINCALKVRSGIFYSRKSKVINKFCNKLCSTFCLKGQFCFTLFFFLQQYHIYTKNLIIFFMAGLYLFSFWPSLTSFFLFITNNLTHLQMSNLCWFIYI